MLDSLYGTYFKKSELKTDYNLPKPIMTKPDIMAIFKDERIRKYLKAPKWVKFSLISSIVCSRPSYKKIEFNCLNHFYHGI